MNLRHAKQAQNAQTDDETGQEPPNSQATAPPATPGNAQRRASPGPPKPQVTESPYRHDKHGQTRTKMQVNKPGQTKPQVTASHTRPWGVTPRPATTGDAHANYHFSPRQLLARGSQSSLGLRWCRERWYVVFVFEVAGWRALFSSSLIRTLFGAGSEPPGAGPPVGWRFFVGGVGLVVRFVGVFRFPATRKSLFVHSSAGRVASALGWRHSYLCRVRLIMSVWV